MASLARRSLLTFGLTAGVCALGDVGRRGPAPEPMFVLKPFARYRTVRSFAGCLLFYDEEMPLPLRRAIDAELDRADAVPATPAQERQCAEFFAWLAVRSIAPRALRRAGYDALAADCEKQLIPGNGGGACSVAQHTIGTQYAYSSSEPPLAVLAYEASARASTAAFYAGHEDIAVVTQTGCCCAEALLGGSFYDNDIDTAEASWLWGFAATAINTAARPPKSPG